jgi:hypothetical protein
MGQSEVGGEYLYGTLYSRVGVVPEPYRATFGKPKPNAYTRTYTYATTDWI